MRNAVGCEKSSHARFALDSTCQRRTMAMRAFAVRMVYFGFSRGKPECCTSITMHLCCDELVHWYWHWHWMNWYSRTFAAAQTCTSAVVQWCTSAALRRRISTAIDRTSAARHSRTCCVALVYF